MTIPNQKTNRNSFFGILWRGLLLSLLIFGPGLQSRPGYAQDNICQMAHQDVSRPLTDLGSDVYIRMDGQNTGETGGLYPEGANVRPPAHEAAGLAQAAQIMPLDVEGNPDPTNGKIVLISIGMSNASSEFNNFISLANDDPDLNPQVMIVNGAQGGRVSDWWIEADAETWTELNGRLNRYKVSPDQVQIAWVKQTQTRWGDFPEKALALQSDLEAISRNLKINYPNIKIVYFSSRTRSYTYWRGLSPEPIAFETGFAVKWLIEKQINGDPALNFDPAQREVVAPYLSWGPYLWADGINPREDGLTWLAEDMRDDCTHPSQSGNIKVAEMLLTFFKNDSTSQSWFLREGLAPAPVDIPATLAPTETPTPTLTAPPPETPLPDPTSTLPPPTEAIEAEDPPVPAAIAEASPTAVPPVEAETSGSNNLPALLTGAAGLGVGLAAGWFLFRRKT